MQLRLILRCLVWECAGDDYGHRAVSTRYINVENVAPCKDVTLFFQVYLDNALIGSFIRVAGVAVVRLQVLRGGLSDTSGFDALPPLW